MAEKVLAISGKNWYVVKKQKEYRVADRGAGFKSTLRRIKWRHFAVVWQAVRSRKGRPPKELALPEEELLGRRRRCGGLSHFYIPTLIKKRRK